VESGEWRGKSKKGEWIITEGLEEVEVTDDHDQRAHQL
jgi:hypothetical protein